ncbi:MAG: hypothetical protein AB3K77_08275 [Methanosarcinaceae archaeon]
MLSPAPIEIDSFDSSPELIEVGGNSTLSWGVSGTTDISIEPGIGIENPEGTFEVSPTETTTYKLTASNDDDEKVDFCTVTVEEEALVINSFDAETDLVGEGNSPVLKWDVSGAKNVTIEPDIGSVDPVGTVSVSPAETTTYQLKASSGDQEEIASCLISVENKLPSIDSFNADSDVIGTGNSSNLVWQVSSAEKVFIEPDIGTVGLNGSQHVFPNETTDYTLIATNEAGSVEATKVVFVEGSSPSGSIVEGSSSSGSTSSDSSSDSTSSGLSSSDSTSSDSTSSDSTSSDSTSSDSNSSDSTSLDSTSLDSTSSDSNSSDSTSLDSSSSNSTSSESTQSISIPKQLYPADGTVFNHSPRLTTLEWEAVPDAASYAVEIDYYSNETGTWLSDFKEPWIVSDINETIYTFEFPDAEKGRWRVWAVDAADQESDKSEWLNFNYVVSAENSSMSSNDA